MRRSTIPLATILLALALPAFARTTALAPLSPADVPALLKPPAHGERILAIWALDCAYCEANMQALAKLQRAHPREIELVTVATDDIAQQRDAIEQRLRAAGMDGYPARAYAAAAPERIDYLLDPGWGGETPRTLVIRADGTHTGFNGALTPGQLQKLH
jgi:iron complex outermembrane receptor protein